MEPRKILSFVDGVWEQDIVPQLVDYIRIPNKSPAFDKDWQTAGHMQRAVDLIAAWCKAQPIEGLTVEVLQLEGRTPLIYMEIPGEGDDCVLLYGHLDKQPEMTGWFEGLGPWEPVRKDDKLYGRGGADDGYSAFASLTAIRALREAGGRHSRCVVIIEGCEESGSYDLPFYIQMLKQRIGTPSLVICLDSGCGNYDQLWCTTSLRGLVGGDIRIDVLTEGVHSGDASGVVPSSFRVFRQLMERLEDSETGRILAKQFHVDIPKQRKDQAKVCAKVLGDKLWQRFPWMKGTKPMAKDRVEMVLNRTWRPYVELTGFDGAPSCDKAGNVLRPYTTAKLSLRIPPRADADKCMAHFKKLMTEKPPSGARITFSGEKAAAGWDAPPLADWLEGACANASQAFFKKPCVYMGEGGTIPFMGMLGEQFPEAQFMITGVLGPQSNAHGPNEFLHIPMGKKLTASVAMVLQEHFLRDRGGKKAGKAGKSGKSKAGKRKDKK
ncbi:MAG: M20 family metallopeptidase [Planctomycetes bacterium]|jgi:acetylornithine deacetylase/succinyl-diaminopimelate desuccinylase-like protein|nr:M20 family metallopeptidase [Planctomycetota bacterium]